MMPQVPQNRKGCGEASRSGHQCEMRHAGVVESDLASGSDPDPRAFWGEGREAADQQGVAKTHREWGTGCEETTFKSQHTESKQKCDRPSVASANRFKLPQRARGPPA